MGTWTTDKKTEYYNVRITKDAKHFPASGEGESKKPSATFLSIVDGTKGGEDIFVDARVTGKRAESLANLKKGAEVTVIGRVEFKVSDDGKLRGKIWDADVKLTEATRKALAAEAAPVDAGVPAGDDAAAPAFE